MQRQINTSASVQNHMHQLAGLSTGGQLSFHKQHPNQQERKTNPDEHMVVKAVMDGREWGA